MPDSSQRRELDRIVWEKLSHGVIEPSSRETARTAMAELKRQGVDAVILGCTELNLLIQVEDTALPLYDTTRIHADAILNHALEESTG